MAIREEGWIQEEYLKRNKMRIDMNVDKETLFNNAPLIYREEEHYINPMEPGWEKRYRGVDVDVGEVVLEYKYGVSWVYRYYRESCVDWRWKYEGVGPLLKEMSGCVGGVKILKKESKEVDVYEQLEYVLAKEEDIVKMKFGWAFCRYAWEGHIK
jgi:5'-3' exonuclease